MTSNEQDVQRSEARLCKAMLESDLEELDALLADELVFTNHLGRTVSKQADLEAHRNGTLELESVATSDQNVITLEDAAVVTMLMSIAGRYDGSAFAADLRFTRVWRRLASGQWQVIAAHSTAVPPGNR